MSVRVIDFSEDVSLGFVHVREGSFPYTFHGRFNSAGDGPEFLGQNEGWDCLGEAKGKVTVPSGSVVMLEVMTEEAVNLSSLDRLASDSLNGIWLGNTFVDDDQFPYLSRLTGLEWLDIQNNGDITDAGVQHIKTLTSLKSLGLHFTRISDKSFDVFRSLQDLEVLDIWGCEMSAEAIKSFSTDRPHCLIKK